MLQELVACDEHRVFGPHLEPLRGELTDEDLCQAVGWLLLVLSLCHDVPDVARRALADLKASRPLRAIVTAIAPLAGQSTTFTS